MEKLIKMTNPNYKISNTRILLKYVNKKLTVEHMRTWIYSLFEGHIKTKKLKTLKLLKDIKILSENDIPKGFIFLEFANPLHADYFMKKIFERKDDVISEIGNIKGDMPIVEYAFDDVKKLRKIEDLKKKQKEGAKDNKVVEEVSEKTKLEKKEFQKMLQNNRKLVAKKLVNDALQQNSDEVAKEAIESINSLRSRGLKHRLLSKLQKRFSQLIPASNNKVSEPKPIIKPVERVKKIKKVKKRVINISL